MGGIARNQPVNHAGAANQPDLPNGQGQQRTLRAAVQLASRHHPGKAPGAAELLLKLLLVKSLSHEGMHLQRLDREGISVLRQLCKAGNCPGRYCVSLQPKGVRGPGVPPFPCTQHRNLLEPLELSGGKTPDSEIVKVVAEYAADIRRQAVIGDNVNQQAAIGQMVQALHQKPLLMP